MMNDHSDNNENSPLAVTAGSFCWNQERQPASTTTSVTLPWTTNPKVGCHSNRTDDRVVESTSTVPFQPGGSVAPSLCASFGGFVHAPSPPSSDLYAPPATDTTSTRIVFGKAASSTCTGNSFGQPVLGVPAQPARARMFDAAPSSPWRQGPTTPPSHSPTFEDSHAGTTSVVFPPPSFSSSSTTNGATDPAEAMFGTTPRPPSTFTFGSESTAIRFKASSSLVPSWVVVPPRSSKSLPTGTNEGMVTAVFRTAAPFSSTGNEFDDAVAVLPDANGNAVNFHSITATPKYEQTMSVEEIRLSHMAAGRCRTSTAAAPLLEPTVNHFKPLLPYPLWDTNWDDMDHLYDESKYGPTRRVLLIRHGQYETHETDPEDRILTGKGRRQAELVGKRLAKLHKRRPISVIRTSCLPRSKESAQIIQKHLPSVPMAEPDSLLNETIPAAAIPCLPGYGNPKPRAERAEEAYRKYFHRVFPSAGWADDGGDDFEVIVGHGNLIRYFLCRAMQFPPEGWSRFSIAHCSITEIHVYPTGRCGCFTFGDYGHLTAKETLSFS